MKLVKKTTATLFAACLAGDLAIAAHPPLDRPTPPPCCADGICYPNPITWGWYETRWRRWPTEELQPTPAPAAPIPGKKIPDIPAYETPPPEEEDRRAPPPTKPRAEAEEGAEVPGEAPVAPPPGGGPEAPRTAPLTPPPGGQLTPPPAAPLTPGPPAPLTPPLTPPPTKMPWENGQEPTGDWDPPPALPTATAVTVDRDPSSRAPNRFAPAQPNRPAAEPRDLPNHDPPPMLPVALASTSY
jgi:hypothetical protein